MKNDFYVYEHWRPDKDRPFYVGKGRGRRAWLLRPRNPHYANVARKLAALGLCVEVRLVVGEMTAEQACAVEIERIRHLRSAGVELTNMTDGGEGMLNPSPEVRQKYSILFKNIVRTPEWCANISKGVSNQSAETRAKRSASMTGIVRSAETRAKVSAAKRNPSPETREKSRQAALRSWAKPEFRAKQMARHRRVPEGELA